MKKALMVAATAWILGCTQPDMSGTGGGGAAGGGTMGGGTGGSGAGGGGDSTGGGAANGGGTGGGAGMCDATTCPGGCCASDGTCQAGINTTACGVGGAACMQCTGTDVCENGMCRAPMNMGCSPSTCTTCCLGDGGCAAGVSFRACGANGAACVTCPGAESCVGGTCMMVKKVFTTWARVRGNFGGVAAADQLCADSAADGGLGGTWVAFVKPSGSNEPSTRLNDVGPWYLHRSGLKVFNSKADITNATEPLVQIGADEDGNPLRASVAEPDVYSWIGDGNGSCNDWASSSPGDNARCGNVRDTTTWRNATTCSCNEERHLYCFEQ